jgi:hypothetical protein
MRLLGWEMMGRPAKRRRDGERGMGREDRRLTFINISCIKTVRSRVVKSGDSNSLVVESPISIRLKAPPLPVLRNGIVAVVAVNRDTALAIIHMNGTLGANVGGIEGRRMEDEEAKKN